MLSERWMALYWKHQHTGTSDWEQVVGLSILFCEDCCCWEAAEVPLSCAFFFLAGSLLLVRVATATKHSMQALAVTL